MKKITLEFDEGCTKEQKRVPAKKGRSYTYKTVTVNNPKAWEIITVENSSTYMPGQRLNKKQVESLCRGASFDVVIGQPGQFRLKTRY